MEELFNLTYKDEVEAIKDEENFEALGDEKYIFHVDMEARLYWAFCRPSGSHPNQIKDPHPLVSIMAFNHSRLGALERFKILNPQVIENEELRKKIRANVFAITRETPAALIAIGACSREEPHPKFFSAIKIFDLLNGSWLRIKLCTGFPASSYLISKNKLLPKPVLLIVFRNCFGIIMSVSTFTIGR